MRLTIFFSAILIWICLFACTAGQRLSQSNVDIQSFNYNPDPYYEKKATSTSTTTETPTTKKGGFFSGIKNLFGGSSKTTVPPSTTSTTTTRPRSQASQTPTSRTTAQSPTPTPARVPSGQPSSTTGAQNVQTPSTTKGQNIQTTPSTRGVSNVPTTSPASNSRMSGPTTARTTTTTDPWPALPPVSSPGQRGPHQRPTTTHRPAVQFIPKGPTNEPETRGSQPRPQSSDSSSQGSVTDEELFQLTDALFNKDTNNVYRYVTVNHQGKTQASLSDDEAPQKLLSVDENHVFNIPTIQKFRALFNNYERDAFVNEHVSANERIEENDFLDAIISTSVMRHTYSFLQQKGVVTSDPKTFKELLKTIWFTTYSRGQGKVGSSGFEHVFVSELKNGTLSGLHNWLYYYDEEKAGRVDYKGFMKKLPLGNKGEILKVRMCIHITPDLACKPTNSMFIGTSPELEMALYTICFSLRPDSQCTLKFNEKTFNIKTHQFKYRGKTLVGSAFPEI